MADTPDAPRRPDHGPRLVRLAVLPACVAGLAATVLAISIAGPAPSSSACTGKAVVSVIGSESRPAYA